MKVVFMGTPDFAVGILETLFNNDVEIVAVITVPDKPAGRGQKISESPVKQFAVTNNLLVLQPPKLKDESFVEELKALNADLFVVVAFRMLPEVVWNMPPKGTINLHASLLPNYRGAAPINWAVINGETKTGVTTFFIEQEIDTGLVIEREECEIDKNETAGELHDKLLEIGKQLVLSSVKKIEAGTVKRISQETLEDLSKVLSAPKIFKPTCEINWLQKAEVVHNFCRGLSPYPTAWTKLVNSQTNEEKTLKIFYTEVSETPSKDSSSILSTKKELLFPCLDFYLNVIEIQLEGKKRMKVQDFLLGFDVEKWKIA